MLKNIQNDLKKYDDMINRVYLENWYTRTKSPLEESYFKNFPIKLLDIEIIFKFITQKKILTAETSKRIAKRLKDIKTLYFFLDVVMDRFYLGTTLIVGKGELEKVDLKTISLLQGNHYRVYLLSCLYEYILNFLELIYSAEIKMNKRNDKSEGNKWDKKFKQLSKVPNFRFILPEENTKMANFYGNDRNYEMHILSNVFRKLYDDKWDHFSEIEKVIKSIVERLYNKELYYF